MRIIGLKKIEKFKAKHCDSRQWLDSWLREVRLVNWQSPHDVKAMYVNASIVGNKTVVFNVKGNDYRMEVNIAYEAKVVSIDWIGTHSEYTKNINRKQKLCNSKL